MRTFVLIASFMSTFATPLYAEIIEEDIGGRIGIYLDRYAQLDEAGEQIVIDGQCLSACTLVLALVRYGKVCATSRGLLGFHAAWEPGKDGRELPSPLGTALLMEKYPPKVRAWIRSVGGLKRKMRFERATRFIPRCRAENIEAAVKRVPNVSSGPFARFE